MGKLKIESKAFQPVRTCFNHQLQALIQKMMERQCFDTAAGLTLNLKVALTENANDVTGEVDLIPSFDFKVKFSVPETFQLDGNILAQDQKIVKNEVAHEWEIQNIKGSNYSMWDEEDEMEGEKS